MSHEKTTGTHETISPQTRIRAIRLLQRKALDEAGWLSDLDPESVTVEDETTVTLEDATGSIDLTALVDYVVQAIMEDNGEQTDIVWYDRPNGVWRTGPKDPRVPVDVDADEPWYGTPCAFGGHDAGQGLCCNTCMLCGDHMCEQHTARCDGCGAVVCPRGAETRENDIWTCIECAI